MMLSRGTDHWGHKRQRQRKRLLRLSSGVIFGYVVFFSLGMLIGMLGTGGMQQQHVTVRVTPSHQESVPRPLRGNKLAATNTNPQQQQQQQLLLVQSSRNSSCGGVDCIKPQWRQHFIWGNFSGAHLDACPDASSWPPGLWTQPIAAATIAPAAASSSAGPPVTQAAAAAAARPGAVLPATLAAQRAIWANQNPPDCKNAKYLVYRSGSSGIGSVLHLESAAFAAAVHTGRVFVEAPDHFMTSNTSYCGPNRDTLDSCYFLPLSNCTLEQAGFSQLDVKGAPFMKEWNMQEFNASNPNSPRVVKMLSVEAADVRALVPWTFSQLLDQVALPQARRFWWWRAQAVAYIVRPNARTKAEIARRKQERLRGLQLQAGCISLYVRHGDKSVESKVWDDVAYESAVTQLREIDSSLTRQVFLSTDDPTTVKYFTSRMQEWSTTFVERPVQQEAFLPYSSYINNYDTSEELLDCLLNLDLSLSCDGFLASFYSNWARLIEELRATVRCKAHRVFYDVGGREIMHDTKVGGLDLNW